VGSEHTHKPTPYEASDADPRLVGSIAAGIALFVIVAPLVLFAVYPGARGHPVFVGQPTLPPEPRLQVDPSRDLAKLRADEDSLLATYGWIDRNAGVVRIPIDRAMALTADRGIAGWAASTADPHIPPRVPKP
jgi:hypothetical protein